MKTPKIYNAKTLFSGVVVGKEDKKFVGIPGGMNYESKQDFCNEKNFSVLYNGEKMIIPNWHKAEAFRKFDDFQGRGQYTLGYFEWSPQFNMDQAPASAIGVMGAMVGSSEWEKMRRMLHAK